MQFLPFAVTGWWSILVTYPLTIIGFVLFAVILHRLANRCNCYGLPRNILFGVVCGAIAFVLFQLYVYLSLNYGLRSIVLGELIAGYETAVMFTVIRRLVFSQQPPKATLSAETLSPNENGVP